MRLDDFNVSSIKTAIRTNCARLLYQFDGDDAIDRSVKELSEPDCDDGISLSEKRIISASCRKTVLELLKRR